MNYYVSVQQNELDFSFTKAFSKADAETILGATPGERFTLEDGAGSVDPTDGVLHLNLKSIGGSRNYFLNYKEVCDQLENPHPDE